LAREKLSGRGEVGEKNYHKKEEEGKYFDKGPKSEFGGHPTKATMVFATIAETKTGHRSTFKNLKRKAKGEAGLGRATKVKPRT